MRACMHICLCMCIYFEVPLFRLKTSSVIYGTNLIKLSGKGHDGNENDNDETI